MGFKKKTKIQTIKDKKENPKRHEENSADLQRNDAQIERWGENCETRIPPAAKLAFMSDGKTDIFGHKRTQRVYCVQIFAGGNATGNASAGRGRNLGERNGIGEVLMSGDFSRSLPRPSPSSG